MEVELSPKSLNRYQKIFERYIHQRNIGFIWYFVQNPSFGNGLFSKWKTTTKGGTHENIGFTLIPEFLSNPRTSVVQFRVLVTWLSLSSAGLGDTSTLE
jgi:hypothetical protein